MTAEKERAKAEKDVARLRGKLSDLDRQLEAGTRPRSSPFEATGRAERIAARVERDKLAADRAGLRAELTEAEGRVVAAARAALVEEYGGAVADLAARFRAHGEALEAWAVEGERLWDAFEKDAQERTTLTENVRRAKARHRVQPAEDPRVPGIGATGLVPGFFRLQQPLRNALKDVRRARHREAHPAVYKRSPPHPGEARMERTPRPSLVPQGSRGPAVYRR